MDLSEEQRQGLNVALNEAILLGLEVDSSRRLAGATFSVFSLPEVGVPPSDTRVQILFLNVGRVAVGLFDENESIPVFIVFTRDDSIIQRWRHLWLGIHRHKGQPVSNSRLWEKSRRRVWRWVHGSQHQPVSGGQAKA
jgi:hypothetical protein